MPSPDPRERPVMLLIDAHPTLPSDPLAMIQALEGRATRSRGALWIALAVAVHVAGTACAIASLSELRGVAREMRAAVQEHLRLTYEIEVERRPEPVAQPEPDEPEPPPPERAPPPPERAPPPPEEDPYAAFDKPREAPIEDPYEEPPAPSEATKVLTDDKPGPSTAPAFVTGEGQGPGYGMVSAAGTGNMPTFRRHATVGGVPGGRGVQLRPIARKDLSRKADLLGDRAWDCPFPVEADASGIHGGVVALVISIRADGRAQSVQVTSDPGYGFGREARQCALRHHYRPARDSDGHSIPATLGPIRIRFTR